MDATIIDVPVGVKYAYECACGRELSVSGPIHMQAAQVECPCGAVYLFAEPGEVTILIAPVLPKATVKTTTTVEVTAEAKIEVEPVRPMSLGTESAYGRKAKRARK